MRNVCNASGVVVTDTRTGIDLLVRAKAAGLTVHAVGGRLSVRGPRTHESLIRQLIEHKQDVLTALATAPQPETPRSPAPCSSLPPDGWDKARALAVQAAVHARLDAIMATLPPDYPHRQARLNVLANERGIVAGLMAKHDPILWGWLASLERLLERWSEEDRMISPSTQKTIPEER